MITRDRDREPGSPARGRLVTARLRPRPPRPARTREPASLRLTRMRHGGPIMTVQASGRLGAQSSEPARLESPGSAPAGRAGAGRGPAGRGPAPPGRPVDGRACRPSVTHVTLSDRHGTSTVSDSGLATVSESGSGGLVVRLTGGGRHGASASLSARWTKLENRDPVCGRRVSILGEAAAKTRMFLRATSMTQTRLINLNGNTVTGKWAAVRVKLPNSQHQNS